MSDAPGRGDADGEFFESLISKGFLKEKACQVLQGKFQNDALGALAYLVERMPSKKETLCRLWADCLEVAYVELDKTLFQPEIVHKIPESIAKKHKVIPVYKFGDAVTLATPDPTDGDLAARLKEVVGGPVSLVFSLPSEIEYAVEKAYAEGDSLAEFIEKISSSKLFNTEEILTAEKLREVAGNQAIVELPVCIILFAVQENATDVHIEPGLRTVNVRFRIDGVLRQRLRLDISLHATLIARLKKLANLDESLTESPQRGRIDFPLPDQRAELSFSTLPTIFGEKALLQPIARTRLKKVSGLREILLSKHNHDRLVGVLKAPYGILLIAGAPGSQKSGLLYSVLKHLAHPSINVTTIDDPVKYRLDGANQVRAKQGEKLDSVSAIEWSLSQDAQVLSLDEIKREKEARLLLEAAQTGHLVVAGIRANDSFQAVVRLFQLGLKPYETLPLLLGVFAQCRARRLCSKCAEKYEASKEEIDECFQWDGIAPVHLYRAKGCDLCGQSGFSGTVALHETLIFDDTLRKLVSSEGGVSELVDSVRRAGFQSMRYDGFKKALRGFTTLEEVCRTTAG